MTWINLDRVAATHAQKMIKGDKKVLERLLTKALGVLQEQGVYALILFLYSRTGDEKDAAPHIYRSLFALLKKLPAFKENEESPRQNSDANYALKFYANHVANDLTTLLLVRELYEQTLIYARYHAKAVKEKEKGGTGGSS